MASTFTTSLGLEIQATGENRSSWGSKTNSNLSLVEEAISGLKTIAMANANVTLTKVNAGTDQSRPMFLRFTGAHTAIRTVTIPTVSKLYYMQNNTTGGFGLSITTGSSSYALAPGQWKILFTDGATIWSSDDLFTESSATRRWDVIAAVDVAGVMEVGRYIDFHNANADATEYAVRLDTGATTTDLYVTPFGGTSKKIWHSGNDGTASGMDADLLDGLHASDIVMDEPANDGITYGRRTLSAVSSWVPLTTIPVGVGTDFWGGTAPAGWLFCYGQSLLRASYPALFAVIGTAYGAADGTHFSLPDKRGRASFGKDNMGGVNAARLPSGYTGGFTSGAVVLGDVGGSSIHTLITGEMPYHSHTQQGSFTSGDVSANHTHAQQGTFTSGGRSAAHTHGVGGTADSFLGQKFPMSQRVDVSSGTNVTGQVTFSATAAETTDHTHSVTISGQTGTISSGHTHATTISGEVTYAGSGIAHNNVPPGIVCNYIIYAGA